MKLPRLKMSKKEKQYLSFLKNNIADHPDEIWYTIALEIMGREAFSKMIGLLTAEITDLEKRLLVANNYIEELENE